MQLSILINHYRAPHLLKLCLRHLNDNLPEDIEKEIIVVDGESVKKTQKMITELFPSVIFIPIKENVGFTKMVNLGLKRCQGEYILILNADIIMHQKETIHKMIEYFEQYPKTGLLGPQLLNLDGSIQNSCFRFYTPLSIIFRRTFLGKTKWGQKIINHLLMRDTDKTKPIAVDWIMGSALFTKKKIIEKVGLFDERYFMYFDDVDWCKKFWQAGYKVIYFPNAQMYHYHIQASKKGFGALDVFFSKYTRTHILSAIKYFWKWGVR